MIKNRTSCFTTSEVSHKTGHFCRNIILTCAAFSYLLRMKTQNGSAWENLQQEYRKFNNAVSLQNQLSFVYNVKKEFIPRNTLITNVKTIAGAGVKRDIDVVNRLIAEYGGAANEWTKKVGKVESSKYMFDIHWYEKNGLQYETKIKYVKEKE